MLKIEERPLDDRGSKLVLISTMYHWTDIINVWLRVGQAPDITYSSGGTNSGTTTTELAMAMTTAWAKAHEIVNDYVEARKES